MNKLVVVTNPDIINDLRANNIQLLYPLKSFCVGYNSYFDINEIDDYCLVNRILNNNDINRLDKILHNSSIKGIVFDDLGIIDIVKDMDITKILILDHLATNSKSINYYLEYVDSVIVSNDLTKEEIEYILNNTNKPLCIEVFGLKRLMYSRRTLLTNYEKYHAINLQDNIDASIDNKYYKIIENEYGTVFYAYPYYNALELLNNKNVLYYIYNPVLLDSSKLINLVCNNDINDIPNSRLFLGEKTFYKVGDKDGISSNPSSSSKGN